MDEKIEKELRERQKRNKNKDDFSNVYKGTIDERLVTKKEVQEKMLQQAMICNSPTDSRPTLVATTPEEMEPMSVEKSMMDEHDTCSIIAKSKTCRDAFFEMMEYREEIFLYLKEKEVGLLHCNFLRILLGYIFVTYLSGIFELYGNIITYRNSNVQNQCT